MTKHSCLKICLVIYILTSMSCSLHESIDKDSSIDRDFKALLLSLREKMYDSYCTEGKCEFPYSKKGEEYILYEITTSNLSENLTPLYPDGSTILFKYNHGEKRVYDSIVEYINLPNLTYTQGENGVTVIAILSTLLNKRKFFIICSDLCMYECVLKQEHNNFDATTLLKQNIHDLPNMSIEKKLDLSFQLE